MKSWILYETREGKTGPVEYGDEGGPSHSILFLDKASAENEVKVSPSGDIWMREITIPDK